MQRLGQPWHSQGMKETITPEEAAELERLYAELPQAYERAAAALRTEPRHRLEGASLARFMEEEEKVATIVRRIKEILGTTGRSWND